LNNLLSEKEARKRLGEQPVSEDMREETNYKLYQEPLALLKAMGPFSAASEALSKSPSSAISESGVKKEEENAKQVKKQSGAKISGKSGSANLSENISKPENQHGSRNAPKFNQDTLELFDRITKEKNILKIIESLEK
jgi:hypothetical protein